MRAAKASALPLLDFVAPLAPLGLALGRLGNFIGQELWGAPRDVPWAMVFPRDPLQLPRHPSQLYQFALEGMLLLRAAALVQPGQRPTWAVSGLFALGYGVLRFSPSSFASRTRIWVFQAFGWMTRGQILCVPMILLGLYMLWFAYLRPGARSPAS
jgi:phosphatidylglycerol:prolipoprotein diacylglycerol transferase